MKKILYVVLLFALQATNSFSQKTLRLYEGKAPGSEDWNYKEIEFTAPGGSGKMVRNVVDPTLTVYLPEKSIATGTAVVICPGGGNIWLSFSSEGTDVAEWLAKKGIAAFVLKYRLNHTPEGEEEFNKFVQDFFSRMAAPPSASKDASAAPVVRQNPISNNFGGDDGIKAMKYVREHAGEYGIDPKKVGVMGFSAGAAVTMYVILNSAPDQQADFAAPIYGGWLGDSKVPDNAPPLFTLAAADDAISAGLPDLFKAWRAAGKSAELHIYSKGGHGFGMAKNGLPVNNWIERFNDWLKVSGF
jgi:acetyl esterase/lipase